MKRTFVERLVPVSMQDEPVPRFLRWCAIAASHVYNAVGEGISKGFLHPSVHEFIPSNAYSKMNLDRKAYAVAEKLGGEVTEWAKLVTISQSPLRSRLSMGRKSRT